MQQHLFPRLKIVYCLYIVFFIFTHISCQKYKTTQSNLKNINKLLINENPKKEDKSLLVKNPWSKLPLSWIYNTKVISESERNIRSFVLSDKFSTKSLEWVEKTKELESMSLETSADTLEIWLDELLPSPLPKKPKYFLGQDAFERLYIARNILLGATDRLCQIAEGNDWISGLEFYEYARDLLMKGRYQESILQSQMVIQQISKKINCNDIDHDNIPIPFDQCPNVPEDKDNQSDDDGCPE